MAKSAKKRVDRQPLVDKITSVVNHLGGAFEWLRTHGPVYITSVGLAIAYSWGWMSTYGGVFGLALACVVWTGELIKPVLGPKIGESGGARRFALVCCAALTIAFCTASSFVAFNVAEEPQRRYEAGQAAILAAQNEVDAADAVMARFDCTQDMPASRCDTFKRRNGEAEARAAADLAEARTALRDARASAASAPSVTVPTVAWYVKLFIGLGIDFVLFIYPWAASERRRPEAITEPKVAIAESAPPPVAAPAKVNDGGWATRRAKYGSSGLKRKAKPALKVHAGGRAG